MGVVDVLAQILGSLAPNIHIEINSNNHDNKSLKIVNKPVSKVKVKGESTTKVVDDSEKSDYILELPASITAGNLPSDIEPLLEQYRNKQISFVGVEPQERLRAVLAFEDDPQVKAELKFFKGKISDHDHILLRSGLYLQHLRLTDPERGYVEYRRISDTHTTRDKRVVWLASAGYFRSHLRALWNELPNDSRRVETFREEFERVINQTPFVVFVYTGMSCEQVLKEVREKVARSLKYGAREKIIFIHGAGRGVRTIREAVAELEQDDNIARITVKSGGKKVGQGLIKASVYLKIQP